MIALYIGGMVLGLAGTALIIWGLEHLPRREDAGIAPCQRPEPYTSSLWPGGDDE